MASLPLDQIAALCRRHGVTRLELFGSATGDRFGPDSDYDFFVEFDSTAVHSIGPYFDFKFALEELLCRPVDLVERAAVRNRTFLRATEHGRQVVYTA